MKFWKKIYLSVFLLFLIFLNSGIVLVFYISYSHNMAEEKTRMLGEHEVIRRSLSNDIAAFGKKAPGEKEFFSIMKEYEGMFRENSLSFVLWQNDTKVFASEGLQTEDVPPEETVTIRRQDGVQTAYVVTAFEINGTSYRLAAIRSLTGLTKLWDKLRLIFLALSGVISVVLAVVLYIMMRRLMRPLDRLSQKTREVADGNYEWIPERGKDEIAQLGRDFNIMTAAVQNKIESQQRFVANLAHELRTPLTSIGGYSEYLLRGNADADRQIQALRYIQSESRRMQQMASQLLLLASVQDGVKERGWDFSREEVRDQGREEVQDGGEMGNPDERMKMTEVSVSECLREAYESCEPLIREKELAVGLEGTDFSVQGVKELLVCLFRNLLENAVRACDRGGEVGIHYGDGKFAICDNGIGMEPEELGRITEPFYRVDKARSRESGGTGLGLALCQDIVTLHRAELRYESAAGEGTEVTVVFSR